MLNFTRLFLNHRMQYTKNHLSALFTFCHGTAFFVEVERKTVVSDVTAKRKNLLHYYAVFHNCDFSVSVCFILRFPAVCRFNY